MKRPESAARDIPARLVTVDALRGIACLAVVLYHIGAYLQGALWTGWWPLVWNEARTIPHPIGFASRVGFQGVSLFLVLSGFCLYLPLVRRGPPAAARVALPSFARARALRILPAYYASIALLWAASTTELGSTAVFRPLEPWDVAVHALLVHNLMPESIWSINGVYWSLALEAQLYVIFPLLVACARRITPGGVALALILLSIAWPAALLLLLPPVFGPLWAVLFESLPARAGEFAAGMAAAAAVVHGVPGWLRRLAPLLALAWLPVTYAVHVTRAIDFPIDKPVCAVSFAALALAVVRAEPPAPGVLMRALAAVGEVSFSLYLIHQPLLLMAHRFLTGRGWSADLVWAMSIGIGTPLLVAVATLLHRLFEAPFLPGGALRPFFLPSRTPPAVAPR